MKAINNFISEKLNINKSNLTKRSKYTLFPKTVNELVDMIREEIQKNGNECSLNHIDVSKLKSLEGIFTMTDLKNFDGDISDWDVSNVEDMTIMFARCRFSGKNSDLSNWDVSNVKSMGGMFQHNKYFNSDSISMWDTSSVENMRYMFYNVLH